MLYKGEITMENKFSTVTNGKLQINTDAIKDMFDQWNELKRDARRPYNENVSKFFDTISENSEQLSSVVSLLGKDMSLSIKVKGVPKAFSQMSISSNRIFFPEVHSVIKFDDLKDAFGDYIDFTKMDDYKISETETSQDAMPFVVSGVRDSDIESYPILHYYGDGKSTKEINEAMRELGEIGINKEVFVTSMANEIEGIIKDFEESFKRNQEYKEAVDNGDIEPDIELV